MRKILAILSLIVLGFSLVAATYGPGTTGANYLKIGLGARAVGLGESYTAAADDTSAIYWNTAGLSEVRSARVDFMQLNWLAGISAKTVFGAYPISEKDTFGAYMMMMDTPQDLETKYAPVQTISYDQAYADQNNKFKSAMSVLNLAYSRKISRKFSTGLGVKVISEDLAGDQANGLALDAGLIYKDLLPNLKLGANVQNLGLKQLRPDEELPMIISAGAAYTARLFNNDLNLLADVKMPNDNDMQLGVGAEYWLGNIVAGRIGYNTFSKMSLGMGLSLMGLVADYAYVPMGDLGVTHRFSVGYVFDAPRNKDKKIEEEKTDKAAFEKTIETRRRNIMNEQSLFAEPEGKNALTAEPEYNYSQPDTDIWAQFDL